MNTIYTLSAKGRAAAKVVNTAAEPSEEILPLFTDTMRLVLEQCAQYPCVFQILLEMGKGKERKTQKYLQAEETALHRMSSAYFQIKKNLVTCMKYYHGEDMGAELF